MLIRTALAALAFAALPQDAPKGESSRAALLEDLEVMQRVLSRKVAEHSPAITGSSTFAAIGGPERFGPTLRRNLLPRHGKEVRKRSDIYLNLAGRIRVIGKPSTVRREDRVRFRRFRAQ